MLVRTTPKTCRVDGCDRPPMARQMCRLHYDRWRNGAELDAPLNSRYVRPGAAYAVPDPRPVRALRMELQRARAHDVSFNLAWAGAVQVALAPLSTTLRREWSDALKATKPAWQSAFYRLPAPQPMALLMVFAEDPEPWQVHRLVGQPARNAPVVDSSAPRSPVEAELDPVPS